MKYHEGRETFGFQWPVALMVLILDRVVTSEVSSNDKGYEHEQGGHEVEGTAAALTAPRFQLSVANQNEDTIITQIPKTYLTEGSNGALL